MRRRLTLATMTASAMAVVVLGLLLALFVRSIILNLSYQRLEDRAGAATAAIETAGNPDEIRSALSRLAASTGSPVGLFLPSGLRLVTGNFDDVFVPTDDDRIIARGRMQVSIPITTQVVDGVLVVNADARGIREQILSWWGIIAMIGMAALLVAALAGDWQARSLARPLEALARDARRLGDGDFSARATRSGIPEQDMVAEALDSTAERLGLLVTRANSFSKDASHQLRTPLTALRLNVEALQYAEDRDEQVAAALAEVERLDATITELLSLTTPGSESAPIDAREVVAGRLEAWRILAQAQGRAVVYRPYGVPPVRARAAAVGQAAQVLLDNALRHGEGTITVTVEVVPAQQVRWVRIAVSDEGPGFDERRLPPPAPADRGTGGRGLSLARSLVTAEGGSLRVEHVPRGARVCLLLPVAPGVTDPDGAIAPGIERPPA